MLLKEVALRGRIGRLMISAKITPVSIPVEITEAFDRDMRRFYDQDMPFALDISEALADELDLRGVPGHLIKRNPATQLLVRRDVAERFD